jgi:4-diphosphocytidyl-2-C-methyl-D-erythritol kinase
MGAGLGGGSSDATYTILGLNEMFNLKLTKIELREIASQLGSDCAFFVENKPQLAKGRGEILSTIQLHLLGYYMKIVNPGIHIGTAEAYNDIKFSTPETSVEQVLDLPIDQWQELLQNSFEKSVFSNHREIGELKSKLLEEGAIYAGMSGSGSTVYGIYSSQPKLSFSKDYERVFSLDFSD